MPTQLDFLKAKMLAYKQTLAERTSREKDGHVSIQIAQEFNAIVEEIKKASPDAAPHLPKPIAAHLAKQFNEVVKEIGEALPDVAPHLPKPIPSSTKFTMMGLSDVGYVDLMIMAEQVLRVLSVVESHG